MPRRTVELTSSQRTKRKLLKQLVADTRADLQDGDRDSAVKLIGRAAAIAHQLHIELKSAGSEPRHRGYMLKNRGVPPTEIEFYRHFHPLEDLVAYLYGRLDVDPIDQTIGAKFTVMVPCRRWGHPEPFEFTRTSSGWDVFSVALGGQCDQSGEPHLFELLRREGIEYPHGLAAWLEELWHMCADAGISHSQLQKGLQALAKWIGDVECNIPSKGVWKQS